MDESLSYLKEKFSLETLDPNRLSPLMLAYVGDAIYEVVVRTVLLKTGGMSTKNINKKAITLVSAKAQSAMVKVLEPGLTENEAAILKRGRNANSATMAKNASVADYRRATGFEALMGYLYLNGEFERMVDLVYLAIEGVKASK